MERQRIGQDRIGGTRRGLHQSGGNDQRQHESRPNMLSEKYAKLQLVKWSRMWGKKNSQ